MAARPVDWIADIIDEGGAVEVVVRSLSRRLNCVFCMPGSFDSAPEMSLVQASQFMSTAKMAW